MRYRGFLTAATLALATVACHAPEKNQKPTANAELTEQELLMLVTEDTKALYNSLDNEGKKLALKLASPSSCDVEVNGKKMETATVADKNLAVKTAAKLSPTKRQDIGDDGKTKSQETADSVTTWHTSWNAGK